MIRTLAILVFLASCAVAAPVPAEPRPDPLAWGYLGIYEKEPGSLVIGKVDPKTPAAKAGLQPDDVFIAFEGQKITSFQLLVEQIVDRRPGTIVQFEIRRDGIAKNFPVRIGARPTDVLPPQFRTRTIPEPKSP